MVIYKIAVAILLALSLSGCGAEMFACKTDASYILRLDGSREVHYSSCKEQIGLDAKLTTNGDIHVRVDKASTQESVIAATLQFQTMMLQELSALRAQMSAMGAGS